MDGQPTHKGPLPHYEAPNPLRGVRRGQAQRDALSFAPSPAPPPQFGHLQDTPWKQQEPPNQSPCRLSCPPTLLPPKTFSTQLCNQNNIRIPAMASKASMEPLPGCVQPQPPLFPCRSLDAPPCGPFVCPEHTQFIPALDPLCPLFPLSGCWPHLHKELPPSCADILGPLDLKWPHADPSLHILFTCTVPRAILHPSLAFAVPWKAAPPCTVLSGSLVSGMPACSAWGRSGSRLSQFQHLNSIPSNLQLLSGGSSARVPATPLLPLDPAQHSSHPFSPASMNQFFSKTS